MQFNTKVNAGKKTNTKFGNFYFSVLLRLHLPKKEIIKIKASY